MAKKPDRQTPNLPASADTDPLASEIAKRLESLIPAGQRAQVVAQMTSLVLEERFSGPIPHPKHLEEYERIHPGSAGLLIGMATSSLDHSRVLQERALDADIADMREGRRLGFAALVILMFGAIGCGLMGKDVIALALLGATVIGTISTLIKGRGKNGD